MLGAVLVHRASMAKRSRNRKDICIPDSVETKYDFVLSWTKNHLGSDEIRHGIVLVTGIRAWPDGLDANQLAEMAETLTAELTCAIEEHGGRHPIP